jgi:hypothetical protein
MTTLTVSELIEERKARELSEKQLDDQLKLRHKEELTEFKKRLDQFQLADWHVDAIFNQIKRAFGRGETELMFTSFPSSFCTDNGRAINISGEPPINEPTTDTKVREPVWLATLPRGVLTIYAYWKDNLQSGGFGFSARIINYPGGMPGDVGLFFSWPRAAVEK